METPTLLGLHHVTAMTADAQANIDFYTGTLGLRMIKLTVNYDDPTSYHLYYGDESGSPGSAMTFFVWQGAYRGRQGTGQTIATAFAVPAASMEYWRARLAQQNVGSLREEVRFGERVIAFDDPDGLRIEVIGSQSKDARQPWKHSDVPVEHGIRGFHSVTLSEEGYEHSADLLTTTMEYQLTAEAGNRFRYEPPRRDDVVPTYTDLVCQPDARRGSMGVGTVHHIAMRTPNDAHQQEWLARIRQLKLNVSPLIDRNYFHSIYFREPGGVLFEIATDGPGFTIDEPLERLGQSLYLPPWLEKQRKELEAVLPPVKIPKVNR